MSACCFTLSANDPASAMGEILNSLGGDQFKHKFAVTENYEGFSVGSPLGDSERNAFYDCPLRDIQDIEAHDGFEILFLMMFHKQKVVVLRVPHRILVFFVALVCKGERRLAAVRVAGAERQPGLEYIRQIIFAGR